jgi:penicillin-binding protein 2
VETSAGGRAVRACRSHPPTPGDTLVLSVDIKLQALVEQLFGERRGALVAIDPRNGEVLAFVSKPTFDPNLFVDGIDVESWRELNESIDKPLLNRALRGTYPPGSTYKPFMAMAALDSGKRGPTPSSTTAVTFTSAAAPSAARRPRRRRWTCAARSSSPATSTTTRWPTRWAWT